MWSHDISFQLYARDWETQEKIIGSFAQQSILNCTYLSLRTFPILQWNRWSASEFSVILRLWSITLFQLNLQKYMHARFSSSEVVFFFEGRWKHSKAATKLLLIVWEFYTVNLPLRHTISRMRREVLIQGDRLVVRCLTSLDHGVAYSSLFCSSELPYDVGHIVD